MGVGCVWVLVALLECSAFIESFRLNSFYIDAFSDVTSSGFPPKRSSFQFLPLENLSNYSNPKKIRRVGQQTKPTTVRYFGDRHLSSQPPRCWIRALLWIFSGARHLRCQTFEVIDTAAWWAYGLRSALTMVLKSTKTTGERGEATSVAREKSSGVFLVLLICLQVAELQSMPEMTKQMSWWNPWVTFVVTEQPGGSWVIKR